MDSPEEIAYNIACMREAMERLANALAPISRNPIDEIAPTWASPPRRVLFADTTTPVRILGKDVARKGIKIWHEGGVDDGVFISMGYQGITSVLYTFRLPGLELYEDLGPSLFKGEYYALPTNAASALLVTELS